MLGLSDLTEDSTAAEYFCKYLSIDYLGSANPSYADKNSGKYGFSYIDWTAPFAGRDAVMAARWRALRSAA